MVSVALAVAVQPAPSVTVTVYVPAAKPVRLGVLPPPPLQVYVNGSVPLVVVIVTEPFDKPHDALVCVSLSVGGTVLVTLVLPLAVHPSASVPVTVYVPAPTLLSDAAVEPVLHK